MFNSALRPRVRPLLVKKKLYDEFSPLFHKKKHMTYNQYMPVTDQMETGGGDALFGGEGGETAAQVLAHVDRIPRRRVVEGVVHILNLHIRQRHKVE